MDAIDAAQKPFLFSRSLSYHQTFTRRARDSSLPFWKSLADDNPNLPSSNPLVLIYTTSLRSIPRTHADCCSVRAIFRGLRVAVDERDLSLHAAFRHELQALVGSKTLPQVFVRGRHVGGAEEVRQLHEAGEIGKLLQGVLGQDPAFVCGGCGGVRFVPCGNCRGSRKVFLEEEGRMRRCEDCNENGLIRCVTCFSSSSFN